MKKANLTLDDLNIILESLTFSKDKFENTVYPTTEIKKQRLGAASEAIKKIRELRNELESSR